ncbi:hypothetical protein, variant [Aphanomyces astaci]|uniref:3'-5' exonuclease domain-containing protein n=1 Tax=Aphanomyces astaci TaxID=112090 RepID=W4G4N8_APHAT|nr:hypothetical protein, variant [Aphanomyces astaci]ETV74246.1 hypothetical protein, variant [Aphanomyces astaci]|eukprot:XP_009836351.1 hypothetical protein, variant [Aphanomyces astaci]
MSPMVVDDDQGLRRRRRRKVVKDLEWSLSSPHLLSSRFQVLPADVTQGILGQEATQTWLDDLHDDPTPLYAFLSEKRRDRASLALGVYFASLLEFWLRHCPTWRVEHLVVGQQLVTAKTSRTVGQLKFVFRMFLPSSSSDFTDMHWEASIKFFLLTSIAPTSSTTDAADSSASIQLEHFVGPHQGENLAWRATEVTRKLDMCRFDVVRAWLRSHFASSSSDNDHPDAAACTSDYPDAAASTSAVLPVDDHHVQSHMLLRGYLFYPLSQLSSTTSASTIAVTDDLDACHLRGWWSVDYAADLVRAAPSHARWAILPKLHWLSPVVAVPSPSCSFHDDKEHEGADNVWVLPGDTNLGLDPIPILDWQALCSVLASHFSHNPTAMPLLVAELHASSSADDPVRRQDDDPAGNDMTNPIQHKRKRMLYVEASRGFVLNKYAQSSSTRRQQKSTLFNGALAESVPWSCEHHHTQPRNAESSGGWLTDTNCDRVHDDHENVHMDLRAMQLVQHILHALTLSHKQEGGRGDGTAPTYAAIKRATANAFLVKCVLAVVTLSSHTVKTVLRVGHLILDVASAISLDSQTSSDEDSTLAHQMDMAHRVACTHPDQWWSVRFLLKAKHVLGGAIASSPRHDQVDSVTTLWVETVVLAMLEPQHKGKWHATAVDLCAAYALPRDDAVACQILSTLLDGRDGGAAAEAFGRTQRWDVASRRSSQLTHVYVNHPHTSAKAARRHLPATSSQIPTHDIADHAHQLSLVQATLDTPLTVHLVETSSQIDTMLTWMDRATNDKTMVVVGLDCEWRPRAFTTNPTCVDGHNDDLYDLGVTVVQLAFPNGHVFVLDCMATCVTVPAVFDRLCRPWIVVTGFCVSGDLDRLVGSYPALARTFQSPHWTCIDLRRVAMSRVRRLAGVGLASLAFTFLNHTMPKHQQCSDWAARPLTAAQVEYAALDAHIVRVLLLYFTADLNEPSICSTSTTCDDPPPGTRVHTNSWPSSWRVVHHLRTGRVNIANELTLYDGRIVSGRR